MITFTPRAYDHFYKYVSDNKTLQISFKQQGCTGYSYQLDWLDHIPEGFKVSKQGDVTYTWDPVHEDWLTGTTVDMQVKGLNNLLVFLNPNEIASCGCGESVTFK
jgi:iron-sulfur cluster assembly accessory protein